MQNLQGLQRLCSTLFPIFNRLYIIQGFPDDMGLILQIFKTFFPPSRLQHIHSTKRYGMSFMLHLGIQWWGRDNQIPTLAYIPTFSRKQIIQLSWNKKLWLAKNSINNWKISVPFPPFFTISHPVTRGGACNRMCPLFKPCRF